VGVRRSATNMKNHTLEEIKTWYKAGKYLDVLSLIEKIGQEGLLHPEVLVLKGCSIQMLEEVAPYELSDAENAFQQALEVDKDYTPAITELAFFYLNVLDDAVRAAPLFERSIKLHKLMLTEAVIGMAECLAETANKGIAKQYLEEAVNGSLDLTLIQNAIQEIEALEE
jgi:tetratricopeptide (TPR) repeat protein